MAQAMTERASLPLEGKVAFAIANDGRSKKLVGCANKIIPHYAFRIQHFR